MLITKDLIVPLYTINDEALSFWDRERVINMSYSQGIELQEGGSLSFSSISSLCSVDFISLQDA